MADTGIFASTTEVIRKAGANASAVSATEAYINDYMTQVESFINVCCMYNWSDNYAGLNTDVKGVLKLVASDFAAIYVIEYDMSNFTSRAEAQTMMDVLRDRGMKGLDELKQEAKRAFAKGA